MNWAQYFFGIVDAVSKKSKDPSTKVGCVIVGESNEILSTGFNGFPMNVLEHDLRYQNRDLKLLYSEHAERNAIYLAARNGTVLKGSIIYMQWLPCADCARALIQVGVSKIVIDGNKWNPNSPSSADKRWEESFKATRYMLCEAQIPIEVVDSNGSRTQLLFVSENFQETLEQTK